MNGCRCGDHTLLAVSTGPYLQLFLFDSERRCLTRVLHERTDAHVSSLRGQEVTQGWKQGQHLAAAEAERGATLMRVSMDEAGLSPADKLNSLSLRTVACSQHLQPVSSCLAIPPGRRNPDPYAGLEQARLPLADMTMHSHHHLHNAGRTQ